ncbi:hypothetical protein Ocin01_12264 [Orchesella cincta]|uniref:Uncharacterized protein n=1 Tax=Orchesella cincta TaxID=48709 RepID=A0A1D2MMZ8_ORCCI|nr:hypothetical protein Ocin01_12264 [Orchesella cincta]
MREKRVNLVLLTCSVLVATCASVSYCYVTYDNSFSNIDKYVAVISTIPLILSGQISSASAATVWIPSEPAINTDGSVQDEFSEVAHVFARPEVKVVKPREEDEITQQTVPWTSLKNEWSIYQKIHSSQRKKKPGKQQIKKSGKPQSDDDDAEADGGDDSSEEDEEEDDEYGGEEHIMPEGRTAVVDQPQPPQATAKKDTLPLAFYGQGNHDDDEKEHYKDEEKVFKKTKSKLDNDDDDDDDDDEDDAEDDDVSDTSKEAASLEDYADYAADDDDDDDGESSKKKQANKNLSFDEIPLAIREMILNDLANQNNGSGYTPNLTPKVSGGGPNSKKRPSASTENDDEENSSEEDDHNNVAEIQASLSGGPEPTPPANIPPPRKGDSDEEDDEPQDSGGKGKGKSKGKGKKGKKGKKPGWGWKPKGWGNIHMAPGWGQKHKQEDHGWGWDPAKHDGVLEQMVRGSTWERVLKYYHWRRDQALHEEKGHGHHDHHDHDDHGGHGFHDDHEPHGPPNGWGVDTGDHQGQVSKIVKGALKGSFWERAFHTYAKYKQHQAENPKKPTLVDLDTDHMHKR